MTKDEALKLALEALETCNWVDDGGYGHAEYDHVSTNKAITAIKEALAQPEQEPVAWVSSEELLVMRGNALGGAKDWRINVGLVKQENDVGLYTTPPQRAWIALTDEERKETLQSVNTGFVVDASVIAIAIEAKLKEKNT